MKSCEVGHKIESVERSEARHALVTAANHLLFGGLPLRAPESRLELTKFLQQAAASSCAAPERHAVLLGILGVLDFHTGGRLPGLVERYLAQSAGRVGRLDVFTDCVEDVLRYRGIGHPAVQRAIRIIEERFADSTLTAGVIAAATDLTLPSLAEPFKRWTSVSLTEYLRDVRLDRVAHLLTSTSQPIKEIWSRSGYNDANFGHDFLKKFRMSPRAYRARSIGAVMGAQEDEGFSASSPAASGSEDRRTKTGAILMVDDDVVLCDITRRLLTLSGFSVSIARDAQTGLREVGAKPFDVIVLDYVLPDLDGIEFLRTLRRDYPGGQPPVALFTADWHVEESADEIASLGAGIVSKLCDFETLERLVRSYCDMPLRPPHGPN